MFDFRQTALHFAVLKNHKKPILEIIDRKYYLKENLKNANEENSLVVPNFNLKNSDGDTPLSLALELGIFGIL